uniref:Uncharacterized protein n=1 Tax=Oryza barthii TaxID=65489 RepID=A0A0D3F2V2_9ORYZ
MPASARGADSPGAVSLGVASPSAVGGAQMVSALRVFDEMRGRAWQDEFDLIGCRDIHVSDPDLSSRQPQIRRREPS